MRSFYLRLIVHGPENPTGWLLYLALWPLSIVYRCVMWARALAYAAGVKRVYRPAVPVVSVGNITVGGTGKTPVVDALIKYLVSQGRKVAVVSRGYKGSFQGEWCRVRPDANPAEIGDEPYLIATRNPEARVYVSRRRRHGVAAAEADGADCIILDDAFQHLAVARDLDVVLLDARAPFGNGALIPAGPLREPRAALHRAGLVVFTHADIKSDVEITGLDALSCRHAFADQLVDLAGAQQPWTRLTGQRCLAFAGIAHPDDFFRKLREAGCDLHTTLGLADHQEYDAGMIEKINAACQDVDLLLTTEKDAVKLRTAAFAKPCLAVPLKLEFDDFQAIAARLDALLGCKDE